MSKNMRVVTGTISHETTGGIYPVSEPGVHNPAAGSLPFRRLGRKLYPMDDI